MSRRRAKAPAPAVSTCSYGTPFVHHFDGTGCAACDEHNAGIDARWAAAVARGEYDEEGYTPKERKAQQRKAAAAVSCASRSPSAPASARRGRTPPSGPPSPAPSARGRRARHAVGNSPSGQSTSNEHLAYLDNHDYHDNGGRQ